MSEHIYAEFNTFCYAIMLGVLCGILYDIIRIFRRIIKKRIAVTVVEDIIYWMVVSVLMFMLMYRENGGMVRGYAIIGMASGMVLYEVSLGKFIVKYVSALLNRIFGLLKIGINKFIKTIKWVLKKVLKPFTIIVKLYRDKKANYKKKHEERIKQKEIEKQKAEKQKENKKIQPEKKGKVHERGSRKNQGNVRKGKAKRQRQSD